MQMELLDLIEHDKPDDVEQELTDGPSTESQQSLDDTMTAYEAWKLLAELYQSSSLANIFQLTQDFNNLQSPRAVHR